MKKTRQALKSFAGVGVTDRRREEAEAEGQHDDVQHEVLLVALVSGRFPARWIAMDQCHWRPIACGDVPRRTYVFEIDEEATL